MRPCSPNDALWAVFTTVQGESLLWRIKKLVQSTTRLGRPKYEVLNTAMQKYLRGYECDLRTRIRLAPA